MLALKVLAVWLLILVGAVVNGAFRESVLVPKLGMVPAFVISGLLLSLCIVVVSAMVLPWFGQRRASGYFLIGLYWLGLTLVFEFSFGHWVQHKTWSQLFDAYKFHGGNLWPLVLVVTAFAPWIAAQLRGLLGAGAR